MDADIAVAGHDAEAPAMIEARGLAMDYGRGAVLLGLDLALEGGAMVGLIGANGSGKSTLLRLLMGLARPTAGAIRVQGRPLSLYRRRALAQLMTLVPQDTQIGFAFRVAEIVAMGRYPHLGRFRTPARRDLALIEDAMARTGVTALADRAIDTLSGGERQRVAVARAIAQETQILLLDEVTASLDLCHQLEVLALAQGLARSGRLVFAALHDLTLASRFCDRLLLLAEGRIQAEGPPSGVLTPANLHRFFGIEARVDPSPAGAGLSITPLAPAPEAACSSRSPAALS